MNIWLVMLLGELITFGMRFSLILKRVLESSFHDLYLSITLENYPGNPLPH